MLSLLIQKMRSKMRSRRRLTLASSTSAMLLFTRPPLLTLMNHCDNRHHPSRERSAASTISASPTISALR